MQGGRWPHKPAILFYFYQEARKAHVCNIRGWERKRGEHRERNARMEEMERDDEGNAVVATLTSNGLQLCRDNRVGIASLPLLQKLSNAGYHLQTTGQSIAHLLSHQLQVHTGGSRHSWVELNCVAVILANM